MQRDFVGKLLVLLVHILTQRVCVLDVGVTSRQLHKLERELDTYADYLTAEMGRPERREAMQQYLTGLLLEGTRKSVAPMAARLAASEEQIPALRQRLQQCVTESRWPAEEVFRRVAQKLTAELPEIAAWLVDDTGFPKKGTHSVGVARQYSGTLGRTDTCQVAVSLHVAGDRGSGCIGMRLYLPQEWAADADRRARVGVPETVRFQEKWRMALDLIDAALAWGLPPKPVVADAAYGDCTLFRQGLAARGLPYLVAVSGTQVVWPPGVVPQPPAPHVPGQPGRPRTRYQAPDGSQPVSIQALARSLPRRAYRKVTWREGSRGPQCASFAARRIRTASGHTKGRPPGPEQWLLCEWLPGEAEPTKFSLSNLPPTASRRHLVRLAHQRWRVERDYQDMKEELGLDHFEGRFWRGFHHHVALCAAAHAFLALRRALFPPPAPSLDPARGAARAPADSAAQAGRMPALPPALRRHRSAAGAIQDVNK